MIKLSRSSRLQLIQKQPNLLNRGLSELMIFCRRQTWLLGITFFCLFFIGCAGRNIHSELKSDSKVMIRKWTISTHNEFVAGDHGFEYSNPIVIDNTVVFGNQSVGLISVYPESQQTRWTLPIKGGVLSELSNDKGLIYFGGGDGFLYAVAQETGRVIWKYDLHNPLVSRPTISGGRLFVTTTDDTVYAFDAATGKWLWHYRRRSSPVATVLGASSPLIDGDEALVGLSDGFLVALNVNDGQLKWERKVHAGTKFTDVDAQVVIDNGILYIPSYDGALYALKRQDGEIIWRFDAGGCRRVTVDDQRIFLPSSDGFIYALQKNNAKMLWKFELDSGVPTRLIVTDKQILVGSSHQYFYVLDKNGGSAQYRFDAGSGNGFLGAPAYDSTTKQVYVLSGAGNLYAFKLRDPAQKTYPHGRTDPYEF